MTIKGIEITGFSTGIENSGKGTKIINALIDGPNIGIHNKGEDLYVENADIRAKDIGILNDESSVNSIFVNPKINIGYKLMSELNIIKDNKEFTKLFEDVGVDIDSVKNSINQRVISLKLKKTLINLHNSILDNAAKYATLINFLNQFLFHWVK